MRRLAGFVACAWLTAVAGHHAAPIQAQASRQQIEVDGTADLRLVSNGNVALLVAQSRRGQLAVFQSANGGPFAPTDFVAATDVLEPRDVRIWATTHGFFLLRNRRSGSPQLSRSVNGVRWEAVDSPALYKASDITGLAQLPNGDLLAVGAVRWGEPPATGVRPEMWRSRDGSAWQVVPLTERFANTTGFRSIAVQGTTVVVSGRQWNKSAFWRSNDAGVSWADAGLAPDRYETVVAISGRFVAFSIPYPPRAPDVVFATSTDGVEWREGVARSPLDEGLAFFPRQSATTASGTFWGGVGMLDLVKRMDWCYVSLTMCQKGAGAEVLLHTATGDAWSAIDLEPLLGTRVGRLAIADTNAGTVVASAVGDLVTIIRVQPGAWPVVTPTPVPSLPALPPMVSGNGSIAPGTVYRYPKYVHCGLEWLGRLNGRTWKLRRQLGGTPQDRQSLRSLPQIQETLFGTIVLTAPDTIEYAIEGIGAVAVYGPTTETPPYCH